MRWKIAVVLAITIGCLAWVLARMDLQTAGMDLAGFQWHVIAYVFAVFTATLLARTLRFSALLDAPVGFVDMLSVVAVSFLAINVVPLRMGELVRPYLLLEANKVPFGTSMAALFLERLLDLFALLMLLFAVSWFVDIPGEGLVVEGIDLLTAGQRMAGTGFGVGMVGVLVLSIGGPPVVDGIAGIVRRFHPGLADVFQNLAGKFVEGFRSLARRPFAAAQAVFHTAIIWVGTLFAVAAYMDGFDRLDWDWSLVLFNWAMTMTGMVAIPTPGFFGGFEMASQGSLELFGVDPSLAGTFALSIHLTMFAFTILSGLVFTLFKGWSLVAVVQASRQEAPAEVG